MKGFIALAMAVLCIAPAFAGQGDARVKAAAGSRIKAAPQLPAALRQALQAYGKLRYTGARIVEFRSSAERQRHTELVTTDGFRSRVEFPPDSPMTGQVIVETPKERRHFLPNQNELRVQPPRREEAFGRIAQMAKRRFKFTQVNGDIVAGLSTQLVSIIDPQGTAIQKLWIEPHSGMVLKREIYDRAGTLQGSFEFTRVNLHPTIDETDFTLKPKNVRVITPELLLRRQMKKGSFQDVRLTGSPYKLEASRLQRIAGQDVLAQLYVGNGRRFTLYQLKGSVDPARLRQQAKGNVSAYAWQMNGASFALIGDLTEQELRALAARLGA